MVTKRDFSAVSVFVDSNETTIYESATANCEFEKIIANVINHSTVALNSFKLYFKPHASAAYVAVISTWSTTASVLNPITTTAVQTLNNATSLIAVDLNRCYAWKMTASTAATSTTVSVYGHEIGDGIELSL